MAFSPKSVGRALIGITGAQGVGKSTFCNTVSANLSIKTPVQVHLALSIGERLKALGIPLGSSASADSVAAVYCAHLHRELDENAGIVLLDRCAVDALAYVRALQVTSRAQTELYERLTAYLVRSLRLVIHLEMRGIFSTTSATHETAELRTEVARLVPEIIAELGIPSVSVYAADPGAAELVAAKIVEHTAVVGVPPHRTIC